MKWIKRNAANIFIAAGLVLVIGAVVITIGYRQMQQKLLASYDAGAGTGYTDSNAGDDILPGEDTEDGGRGGNYTIRTIDRKEYKSGMMVISIPRTNLRACVMTTTRLKDLNLGPGLYEISPLPGSGDVNVCIAAHRLTYFKNLDQLKEGDDIILELMGTKYIYKVERVFIVEADDWSVTEPTGCSSITLTTCRPMLDGKHRLVARGRLVKTTPAGQ
jgi:LPXTG-site transpeptidase (sortase) family protein